jgi:hypothetical protein
MILVANNENTRGVPATVRMLTASAAALDAIEAGIRLIVADTGPTALGDLCARGDDHVCWVKLAVLDSTAGDHCLSFSQVWDISHQYPASDTWNRTSRV